MIRVLITASRTWEDPGYIWRVLDELLAEHGRMVLYNGKAKRGGDLHASNWYVRRRAAGAPVVEAAFAVDRTLDGPWPAAGHRRNTRMVKAFFGDIRPGEPFEVHAFLRDNSSGTTGCIKAVRGFGVEPKVHDWDKREVDT